MDSVLACCAGGPGSIPTVGKSKKLLRWFFLSALGGRLKKMEPDMINLRDLASPCSIN